MWNSNPVFEVRRDGMFELTSNFLFVMPWSNFYLRDVVEIPRGYPTNFASIPALARALVSPIDPDIIHAAWVHDYLVQEFCKSELFPPVIKRYVNGELVGRKRPDWNEAAFLFRRIMKEMGAPAWKRGICYAGVRIHGRLQGKK